MFEKGWIIILFTGLLLGVVIGGAITNKPIIAQSGNDGYAGDMGHPHDQDLNTTSVITASAFFGDGGNLTNISMAAEVDPWFNSSDAFHVTSTLMSNWNTSYSWGDHSGLYALLSHWHNDSYFLKSILDPWMTNWNTSYGWGDHSIQGYAKWPLFDQDLNTTDDVFFNNVTATNATFEYVDKLERAAPSNPPADTLRLYVEDYHGFSFYKFLDSTGMKRSLVRDSVILVKNIRGSTIAANRIVYATGSDDDVPTVDLAKSDDISTMPAIGVTIESIDNDSFGRVMQVGLLENINTDSLEPGDILYVSDSTAGIPMTTVPVTPSFIQEIGTVLVKDAAVGSIQIVARSIDGNEFGTVNDFIVVGNCNASAFFGDGGNLTNISSAAEVDPWFNSSDAFHVTSTLMSNWNTSYSWGDHSGLYALLSHWHNDSYFLKSILDPWMANWNTSYNWGPQIWYNQNLNTTNAVAFTTVNTGQGPNELYDMDQNVLRDSDVDFAEVDINPSSGDATLLLKPNTNCDSEIIWYADGDADYWRYFLEEEDEDNFQLQCYDASTSMTHTFMTTVLFPSFPNKVELFAFGPATANYGITLGTTNSFHDKGYAHTFIDASDPLVKEVFDIPVDKLLQFYDAVNIIAYYNKNHYWNENGDLIIGDTDYSNFEIGCNAEELKNSLSSIFGDKVINSFIYERNLDRQQLMGISYRNLQMAIIEGLRVKVDILWEEVFG